MYYNTYTSSEWKYTPTLAQSGSLSELLAAQIKVHLRSFVSVESVLLQTYLPGLSSFCAPSELLDCSVGIQSCLPDLRSFCAPSGCWTALSELLDFSASIQSCLPDLRSFCDPSELMGCYVGTSRACLTSGVSVLLLSCWALLSASV